MDRMTTTEAVRMLDTEVTGLRSFPRLAAKWEAASRLVAAMAEEVRAGRAYDDHCEGDLAAFDPEKERELYSAVTEARAAVDAITDEFKEKA